MHKALQGKQLLSLSMCYFAQLLQCTAHENFQNILASTSFELYYITILFYFSSNISCLLVVFDVHLNASDYNFIVLY